LASIVYPKNTILVNITKLFANYAKLKLTGNHTASTFRFINLRGATTGRSSQSQISERNENEAIAQARAL